MPKLSRKSYIEEYHKLGKQMFKKCTIPTVYTFADAYINKNQDAIDEINTIAEFSGSTSKITSSVNRRNDLYSNQESKTFMQSVIAANVTDITESGHFYKKLMSSCDDMTIDIDDCGSTGIEIELPIDEDTFNYRVRNHWVMELDKYVERYKDIPKKGTIHIRTFLSCTHGTRHFCKKCAGLFRRSYNTEFTPKHIGLYATLMITEHATQASLDSMNKGTSEKVNVMLEQPITNKIKKLSDAKAKIEEIITEIGNVGVESRFYEVALLSRWRDNNFKSLMYSFHYQEDKLGTFIYSPSQKTFVDMVRTKKFNASSTKSKIAFDKYDTED